MEDFVKVKKWIVQMLAFNGLSVKAYVLFNSNYLLIIQFSTTELKLKSISGQISYLVKYFLLLFKQ